MSAGVVMALCERLRVLIEWQTGSACWDVEAREFNEEIWLCWSESVVRFGNTGSMKAQSGTMDEKAFVSMTRVCTVVKRRLIQLGVVE